jgi:hypothetical protein
MRSLRMTCPVLLARMSIAFMLDVSVTHNRDQQARQAPTSYVITVTVMVCPAGSSSDNVNKGHRAPSFHCIISSRQIQQNVPDC